MTSIRTRLLVVLAAGFAVLIGGTGLWLASHLREQVTAEFDVALLAKARVLQALTEQEDGQIELDYEPAAFPEFEREETPEYFQFWLEDGKLLLTSKRLRGNLPRAEPTPTAPLIRDAELPDGRPGRIVQLAFEAGSTLDMGEVDPEDLRSAEAAAAAKLPGLILVVARSRERLDGQIGGIFFAILGAAFVTILLATLFVWRALAVGLKPLDAIAGQVRQLDAERLGSRVGLPMTPEELKPIVGQLNALLERLHLSFERERRFAGNVAHELRTPIAELRALAEVGGRWPDDEEAVARFFDDVESIAGRMEGVVADLLLLARCQAGIETVERSPVSLREALLVAWSRRAADAAVTGLTFEADVRTDLVIDSDASKLGILLANVFGNAVSYTLPGGDVRCVARQTGGRFHLEVSNPAEALSEAELSHLTEPFWRKDDARSSANHAGLGLAVVSEIATLLGWTVAFSQEAADTFCVRFEGPARAAAKPAVAAQGVS